MRGRGVPPLVKKVVFGVLAKILFIQLDIAEGCSCTKAKVKAVDKKHLNKKPILFLLFASSTFYLPHPTLTTSNDGSSSVLAIFLAPVQLLKP